jgi:flagellar M-ring protein FliF
VEKMAQGIGAIPVPKLLGMIFGVAVSAAIAFGVISWGASPNYMALYTGLESRDASEVVAALQSAAIPFKLDGATGSVMVAAGRVHEARLKLAAQGLPKGTGVGVEMLHGEQNFGTSQFVESARYHHAMETELARTISTMANVKTARVHLAIPKRSVFVRNREAPSASISLSLYGGRVIEQGQVNAIIHLVASSIAHLTPSQVTVIDQSGRLLSSGDMDGEVAMSGKQYDYTKKVEKDLAMNIERLLEPIIGMGKVRATINAEIDFTQEESTEEVFNPANQSVRSEQSSSSARFDGQGASGVPGVLSNQPPAAGALAQGAGDVGGGQNGGASPLNKNNSSVRNYELDRTIRHKKQGSGLIKRLTVAVLVDDHTVKKGRKTEKTPLTPEEMARITTLVQQTIGYNEERGDKVNVINASFTPAEEVEALPEISMIDQPWIRNIAKQVFAGIIILVLLFVVVVPTAKSLANYTPPAPTLPPAEIAAAEQARIEHQEDAIPMPSDHDQKVEFAKSMVAQDPRKVANVVKDWIGNEG